MVRTRSMYRASARSAPSAALRTAPPPPATATAPAGAAATAPPAAAAAGGGCGPPGPGASRRRSLAGGPGAGGAGCCRWGVAGGLGAWGGLRAGGGERGMRSGVGALGRRRWAQQHRTAASSHHARTPVILQETGTHAPAGGHGQHGRPWAHERRHVGHGGHAGHAAHAGRAVHGHRVQGGTGHGLRAHGEDAWAALGCGACPLWVTSRGQPGGCAWPACAHPWGVLPMHAHPPAGCIHLPLRLLCTSRCHCYCRCHAGGAAPEPCSTSGIAQSPGSCWACRPSSWPPASRCARSPSALRRVEEQARAHAGRQSAGAACAHEARMQPLSWLASQPNAAATRARAGAHLAWAAAPSAPG